MDTATLRSGAQTGQVLRRFYRIVTTVAARVLFLSRHGETDWNAEGRWQGQTDVSLNATGRAQATRMAELLRGAELSWIVSSDLARASETARIVGAELGLDVEFDRDLRERSFGVFEGLTREECARLYPDAWEDWLELRRTPPGAETHETLAARVTAAIARATVRCTTGSRVGAGLVVTHGGAIRAAVAAGTGVQVPPVVNGAVFRVEWEGHILRFAVASG
jgi:probable phosphoglycerate mutase